MKPNLRLRRLIRHGLAATFLLIWSGVAAADNPARSNDLDIIFLTTDPLVERAEQEARDTLESDFFARMERPDGAEAFMLKVAMTLSDGRQEHVWLSDIRRIGDDRGAGKLVKAMKWFGARVGTTLLFHMNEVSDWRFMLNGKMHGARTIRVLLQRTDGERAEELREMLAPLE